MAEGFQPRFARPTSSSSSLSMTLEPRPRATAPPKYWSRSTSSASVPPAPIRGAKLADYAEAGIPHYWFIGSEDPVILDAFRLDGTAYRPVVEGATGIVDLDQPTPVQLDLANLLPT